MRGLCRKKSRIKKFRYLSFFRKKFRFSSVLQHLRKKYKKKVIIKMVQSSTSKTKDRKRNWKPNIKKKKKKKKKVQASDRRRAPEVSEVVEKVQDEINQVVESEQIEEKNDDELIEVRIKLSDIDDSMYVAFNMSDINSKIYEKKDYGTRSISIVPNKSIGENNDNITKRVKRNNDVLDMFAAAIKRDNYGIIEVTNPKMKELYKTGYYLLLVDFLYPSFLQKNVKFFEKESSKTLEEIGADYFRRLGCNKQLDLCIFNDHLKLRVLITVHFKESLDIYDPDKGIFYVCVNSGTLLHENKLSIVQVFILQFIRSALSDDTNQLNIKNLHLFYRYRKVVEEDEFEFVYLNYGQFDTNDKLNIFNLSYYAMREVYKQHNFITLLENIDNGVKCTIPVINYLNQDDLLQVFEYEHSEEDKEQILMKIKKKRKQLVQSLHIDLQHYTEEEINLFDDILDVYASLFSNHKFQKLLYDVAKKKKKIQDQHKKVFMLLNI